MNKIQNDEQGNILLSCLFILVSMNMIGASILQNSTRDLRRADYKFVESSNYHLAESCIHGLIAEFETLTQNPTTLTTAAFTPAYLTDVNTQKNDKLDGFTIECEATFESVTQIQNNRNVGQSIGNQTNGGGNLQNEFYYEVIATGSGPNSSQKTINSIISVIF